MQYADYAMAELEELQKKYKDVLVKAKDNITQSRSSAAVDEIDVFWFENKKFVEFIRLELLINFFERYTIHPSFPQSVGIGCPISVGGKINVLSIR